MVLPARNDFHHRTGNSRVNDWYTLVAGFGSDFVHNFLAEAKLKPGKDWLIDPFMGMGTTLVTAKQCGIPSIGCDASPFAHFVSRVKTTWDVDQEEVKRVQDRLRNALSSLAADEPGFTYCVQDLRSIKEHLGWITRGQTAALETRPAPLQLPLFGSMRSASDLPEPEAESPKMPKLAEWLSEAVLRKLLLIKSAINKCEVEYGAGPACDLARLALASILLPCSNLEMAGPKVRYRRRNGKKVVCVDGPVLGSFLFKLGTMGEALSCLPRFSAHARPVLQDARAVSLVADASSIAGAVTSPPYLNEVDYLDNTRLEMFFLDFVKDVDELKHLKQQMLRANTKYLYKDAIEPDALLRRLPAYVELSELIQMVRVHWVQRSWGWDHPRLIHEYFAGMAEHLHAMLTVLRPGARYDLMVGDSAIDGVLIPTDVILRDMGLQIGFAQATLQPFRSRGSSRHTTKLRETIVSFVA